MVCSQMVPDQPQEEGYELSDEQLESVAGGWGDKCDDYNYCFDDGRNIGE